MVSVDTLIAVLELCDGMMDEIRHCTNAEELWRYVGLNPRTVDIQAKVQAALAAASPHDCPKRTAVPTELLLDKFPVFDPTWPDEVKTKWFAAFETLCSEH